MDRPSRGIGTHPLQVDSLLLKLVEYEEGRHGVGLGLNTNLPLAEWSVKLDEWMRKRGLLERE